MSGFREDKHKRDKHGNKKTWLLTGFDTDVAKDQKRGLSDGNGKFSPRHVPTQTGPMFSRPGLGADSSFTSILAQIFPKSNHPDRLAFDGKEGWITMNGTHVKVDDKGNVVAGPSNITSKTSGKSNERISITGNEMGRYADVKELRQKAVAYYKANLQGKPAHREDIGEIRFSRKGLEETRYFSANTDKLLLLPALRGIIETGTLGQEEKLNHPRKDGIVAFLPISKTVNFKGKPKKVEVLVGKDGRGNLYYDLFLDNSRKKESLGSDVVQKLRFARDSVRGVTPVLELNIRTLCPRVNAPEPRDRLAFDRRSLRHFDANGFLHVAASNISKEAVNPYYGREIPGWRELGLDPGTIYHGYRSGEELTKAATTFNGLPLLNEHVHDSAEDPQKEFRVGSLGTNAAFVAPYLTNSLIITDAATIAALDGEDGGGRARRELSAAYRYEPVWKGGVFEGQKYDFIMTNIRGNHVALVEEGRAGPDVLVADARPQSLQPAAANTLRPPADASGSELSREQGGLTGFTPGSISPAAANGKKPADANGRKKGRLMAGFLDKLKGLIREAEAHGATPRPGGEHEARQFMKEEKDLTFTGDDEAGDLGERALALIDSLEDAQLADFLTSLVEGALPEGGATDGEGPEDRGAMAEKIAAQVEQIVKEVLAGEEAGRELLCDEDETATAQDAKPRMITRRLGKKTLVVVPLGMDSGAGVRRAIRAMARAAKRIEPLMGSDVDPFAFDSVSGVYAAALEANGMDPKKYAPAAYEGMVDALLKQRAEAVFPAYAGPLAQDGAASEPAPQFKHLASTR